MFWDSYAHKDTIANNTNDQRDSGGEGGTKLYDLSITWTIVTLTMTKMYHINLKNHEESNY